MGIVTVFMGGWCGWSVSSQRGYFCGVFGGFVWGRGGIIHEVLGDMLEGRVLKLGWDVCMRELSGRGCLGCCNGAWGVRARGLDVRVMGFVGR